MVTGGLLKGEFGRTVGLNQMDRIEAKAGGRHGKESM